jgi:outer membrane receptor protein involved in Fe transport
MRRFLLTFLTLALPAFAFAQEPDRQVKGIVLSAADGTVLPGVSVMLKGTNNGTTADSDGKFALVSPASGGVLVFSFIGFASQEVEIGSESDLRIELSEDFTQLSEVVITALGIEKSRQSLGYALQDVKGEQLAEARSANLVNALSGKIAGVRISPNSGPGSGSSVQIRGQSSVSGVNQPLFVVDGVPMEQSQNAGKQFGGGMSEISPDNVASISVLKGPSRR